MKSFRQVLGIDTSGYQIQVTRPHQNLLQSRLMHLVRGSLREACSCNQAIKMIARNRNEPKRKNHKTKDIPEVYEISSQSLSR